MKIIRKFLTEYSVTRFLTSEIPAKFTPTIYIVFKNTEIIICELL